MVVLRTRGNCLVHMQALDENINFVHDHARHTLDLDLQVFAQSCHRFRNSMPLGKHDFDRHHDPEIIIAVHKMFYMGRADTVYFFKFFCNDVHNALDH